MRYIGSKLNLLPFIERVVADHCGGSRTFVDLFSGTSAVGRRFKEMGYQVTSVDLMAYAWTFGRALVQNNEQPRFERLGLGGSDVPLRGALAMLNTLPPRTGFMSLHYAPCDGCERMYFTPANAGRIDAIRGTLEEWKDNGSVTDDEFHILLAALLDAVPSVSNISGTYGAYLKFWESRSAKRLTLEPPNLVISPGRHVALREDANSGAARLECDILYMDPPYNTRQYASNYHILETVAEWDGAPPHGVSGLPKRPDRASAYCSRNRAGKALMDIMERSPARHILLSYNSEGIVPHAEIVEMMAHRGDVSVFEEAYRRFRSDSDGPARRYKADAVTERLYLVTRR